VVGRDEVRLLLPKLFFCAEGMREEEGRELEVVIAR
jgi:hypothetical protein